MFLLDQASQSKEYRSIEFLEGNIKSLLFGKAASKLPTDLKSIPSPFAMMKDTQIVTQKYNAEFSSKIWAHFKFDKQAILNCL